MGRLSAVRMRATITKPVQSAAQAALELRTPDRLHGARKCAKEDFLSQRKLALLLHRHNTYIIAQPQNDGGQGRQWKEIVLLRTNSDKVPPSACAERSLSELVGVTGTLKPCSRNTV